MMPTMMSGCDRTYTAPKSARLTAGDVLTASGGRDQLARRVALGLTTAWDLFAVMNRQDLGCTEWADKTLDQVLASASKPFCPECDDTGFYAIEHPENPDILVSLLRSTGEDEYETLLASGLWSPWSDQNRTAVMVTRETADDLAEAILSGGAGLVRRYSHPVAWLKPGEAITAASDAPVAPPDEPVEGDWTYYAVVDDLDPGAVLQLIRMKPGPELQVYDGKDKGWVDDPETLAQLQGVTPPPLVELDPATLADVSNQIDSAPADGSDAPTPPVDTTKTDTATAAGMVADAPLTVSPDPRAEKLRRYWSTGEGAFKIRWGTPGDWTRCYRHLSKYMGTRAKGYCQNLHKRNTGVWTGSKLNASVTAASIEAALMASLAAGQWAGDDDGKVIDMGAMVGIRDGVYAEALDNIGLLRSLTAGAFPVKPPDGWFANPNLSGPTPLTVEDDGRVAGHIATFDVAHIGLPGKVHAPKSRSNYAYFKTGVLRTAGGKDVSVGQLTLAGGHAPLSADAGTAVAHYDETASAVADVNIGEDRYGIWVAGSLRPEIKPEQVRTLRASAPSGDWRPINGSLELVAICQVNVPGFPVARARVASGAITALVAAGARSLATRKAVMLADAAVSERLEALENTVYAGAVPVIDAVPDLVETPVDTEEPGFVIEETEDDAEGEDSEELPETDEATELSAVDRARALVAQRKRLELRAKVHGTTVSEEAELENMVVASGKKRAGSMPDGSFPIANREDLKKAIKAHGRAKNIAAAKRHIKSRARALKATDLIPDAWTASLLPATTAASGAHRPN